MTRYVLLTAAALGLPAAAAAQYPAQPGYPGGFGGGYGGGPGYAAPLVQPNIYNPANQPLSPSNRWERNRTAGSWAAMAARSPP